MENLSEAPVTRREATVSLMDLRYESCRMKQAALEERLLGSIAERGIEEPLEVVELGERPVLLNGFKRYRCARKLRMETVPIVSLGQDEATGIIALLRVSRDKALSILEQAAFIDELKNARSLNLAQIAAELSRSKAWVSLRLGLIGGMSAAVRQKLFGGGFPVYAYMYTLRPFMRINGGGQAVEEFVVAVSGRGLSVRQIEGLARGYFHGGEVFRQEVRQGHLELALARMKAGGPAPADGCSEFERAMLRDLELAEKAMRRVLGQSEDRRLESAAFHAQAQLLSEGILSRVEAFGQKVRRLHDRGGPA